MDTEPQSRWGLDPRIDIAELAIHVGVLVGTVYDWRTGGKGPIVLDPLSQDKLNGKDIGLLKARRGF